MSFSVSSSAILCSNCETSALPNYWIILSQIATLITIFWINVVVAHIVAIVPVVAMVPVVRAI